MKYFNLNSIATLFFVALFALTSCQKEDLMADLSTPATQQLNNTNSNRAVSATGIQFVNNDVKTQATLETVQNSVTERSRFLYLMECGSDYTTTTVGEGSTLNTNHYPSCVDDIGDPFTGNDMIYHLTVPSTPEAIVTHTVTLSEMTADLDLFVFALDNEGRIAECKAVSVTIGNGDESISMTDMTPGCYIVVVDGFDESAKGEYRINMDCSAISANPPSISLIDVNRADYGSNGQKLGTFHQMTATTWKEVNAEGPHHFTETGRDEWSVYLRDDSRGLNIQLDIYTKKVMYSDDNGNAFELYEIMNSTAKMSGFLVSNVLYSDAAGTTLGNFNQTASQNWTETNTDGEHFFTEVARDEWSVYIRDNSRGINIQLDLHTAKVMYSDDDGNAFELYQIVDAQ